MAMTDRGETEPIGYQLTPALSAAWAAQATNAQYERVQDDEKSAEWRAVDVLQQEVLTEYEREVLDPRRAAWQDVVSFLGGIPAYSARTTVASYSGDESAELGWKFQVPRLMEGSGESAEVRVDFQLGRSRGSLSTEIDPLYQLLTGQKQKARQFRAALGAVGLQTKQWGPTPELVVIRNAFLEQFVPGVSYISGSLWTRAAGQAEWGLVLGTACTMKSDDLKRPEAIKWVAYKPAIEYSLSANTLHAFKAAVVQSGVEGQPLQDYTLEASMDFMRQRLDWRNESAALVSQLITQAKQSAAVSP